MGKFGTKNGKMVEVSENSTTTSLNTRSANVQNKSDTLKPKPPKFLSGSLGSYPYKPK